MSGSFAGHDEDIRVADLESYEVLDSPPEEEFDLIVSIAARALGTPMAAISLVDRTRQWFKARVGIEVTQTARVDAVCDHTIRQDQVFLVPDLAADPRFAETAMVAGPPFLRFYAGAPLVTPRGGRIGTLCVLSPAAGRDLQPAEAAMLENLANLAMKHLEQRRLAAELVRAQRYRASTDAILQAISANRPLDEVLHVALDRICRHHGAAIGRIWKLNNGRLHPLADFAGRPGLDDYFERSRRMVLTPANSGVARSIMTGQAQIAILDQPEDLLLPLGSEMVRLGMRCQVWQPVDFQGERLALIMSFDTLRNDLTAVAADIESRMDIIRAAVASNAHTNELNMLRSALDHATDAVMITEAAPLDEPGPRIVFTNRAFTRMTGYTRAEAIGRSPRFLQGADTDRAELSKLRQAMAESRPTSTEVRNYRKDGTPFWLESAMAPVTGTDGLPTHFVAVQRDVTERRAHEAAARRAETMRTIGQIASGVAHDFNNILTVIELNLMDVQDQGALPDTCATSIGEALQAARHGAQLVKSLLAYARGKPGPAEPIDPRGLFDDVRPILQRAITSNITIAMPPPPALSPCMADRGQLEAALINLVLNARDAMPGGGTITVAADLETVKEQTGDGPRPGNFVAIRVADTGTGMTQAVLGQAFEPFFTTKEMRGGTGLGLAQVQGFVRHCGGAVRIDSRPGQGTEVVMLLPAAGTEAEPVAAPQAAVNAIATQVEPASAKAIPATAKQPTTAGGTVLVVDDEPAVRRAVAQMLRSTCHVVAEAGTVAEARAAIRANNAIGLVLTDLNMPGESGLDLLEWLRASRPGMPAIIMTGYLPPGQDIQGCTVIRKPFRTKELLEQVRALSRVTAET